MPIAAWLLFASLQFTVTDPVAEPPAEGRTFVVGELVEGVECRSDPSQTYTLYLPSAYTHEQRWPALLILDPRGRSKIAAELFRQAAEDYGWILMSSNDTRSDGPMEPNVKALAALWPEVHRRFATDPQRIYSSGFSGGAMLSWDLARQVGGIAGVIAAGGRFQGSEFQTELDFPSWGAVGTTDFNYSEMRRVHQLFDHWGAPERLEVFKGRHSWMPPELARQAIEWMELQAMKQDLRPRDPALVERLYAADLDAAEALLAAGEELAAARRFAAVAATFEGLRPVEQVTTRATELDRRPAVKKARRDEKRWDAYELKHRDRLTLAIGHLRQAEEPVLAARFAAELGIPELRQKIARGGYQAVMAQRVLETIFTNTSFYLMRDFFQAGDYRAGATVLEVAVGIHPERRDLWYNLACARARSGRPEPAIDALEQAIERGFVHQSHIERDADLKSLRGRARYRQLIDGLESAGGGD